MKVLFASALLTFSLSSYLFGTVGISNTVTNWETEKADTKEKIREKKEEIKKSILKYEEALEGEKKAMVEKLNRLTSVFILSRRANIEMKSLLHEKTMANLEKK